MMGIETTFRSADVVNNSRFSSPVPETDLTIKQASGINTNCDI